MKDSNKNSADQPEKSHGKSAEEQRSNINYQDYVHPSAHDYLQKETGIPENVREDETGGFSTGTESSEISALEQELKDPERLESVNDLEEDNLEEKEETENPE